MTNPAKHSRGPYTAVLYGSSWERGPVSDFATIHECREWAESYGTTANACMIYTREGVQIASHSRDMSGRGERWFKSHVQ